MIQKSIDYSSVFHFIIFLERKTQTQWLTH
nr:MAG TPA: hypothetical protein [Caudoviricetes sp.]